MQAENKISLFIFKQLTEDFLKWWSDIVDENSSYTQQEEQKQLKNSTEWTQFFRLKVCIEFKTSDNLNHYIYL